MSAAEGCAIAQDVIETIEKDRSDDAFDLFQKNTLKQKDELQVEDPRLP